MRDEPRAMGLAECCDMEARRSTVREALENKKQSMTKALADVQAAIDALDANPEVSKVLELLARAGTRL